MGRDLWLQQLRIAGTHTRSVEEVLTDGSFNDAVGRSPGAFAAVGNSRPEASTTRPPPSQVEFGLGPIERRVGCEQHLDRLADCRAR